MESKMNESPVIENTKSRRRVRPHLNVNLPKLLRALRKKILKARELLSCDENGALDMARDLEVLASAFLLNQELGLLQTVVNERIAFLRSKVGSQS